MAKTYMPSVERRIVVRPNPVFGIINYDLDNAYPQRFLEIARQSPTAKKCWDTRAKYLHGNGFEEPGLGDYVVNENGLTLAMLLKLATSDMGLFPGFGMHFNYNANYKIVSANLVKYEDIRQGDTDCDRYKGKYVVYKDWGHKLWRSIFVNKFDVIDPFNPDPKVIKAQVIAAGGWENYKGQIFYLTPRVDDYELCKADPAFEDIQTEAGIKVFNNRQVETGFLPSAVIFMKARREEADNIGPESMGAASFMGESLAPTEMEKNLADFQGAKNAQKIVVVEWDGAAEDKPELAQYQIQNNDKLFEVTAKSVEGNIIKAWDIPKELIQASEKNGLNNSGAEKREAIREYNDNTAQDRMLISATFKKIFQDNWYEQINPSGNWNIIEVTTEGAGIDVIKYADKLQAYIESPRMTRKNKISGLVNIWGFKIAIAEEMIPDDEFIKEASQVAEAKPAQAASGETETDNLNQEAA